MENVFSASYYIDELSNPLLNSFYKKLIILVISSGTNLPRRLPTYEFELSLENDRQRNLRHSLRVPLSTLNNSFSINNKSNSEMLVSKIPSKISILPSDYEEITDEKRALIQPSDNSSQKRSQSSELKTNTNVKNIIANSHSMSRLSSVVAQI